MSAPSPQISPQLEGELVVAARKASPAEACGVLIRTKGGELAALDVPNRSPHQGHYLLDPQDVARALRGRPMIGTWHSHPRGEAYPSSCDKQGAWEGSLVLILGLAGRDVEVTFGLWLLQDGVFQLLERHMTGCPPENAPSPAG